MEKKQEPQEDAEHKEEEEEDDDADLMKQILNKEDSGSGSQGSDSDSGSFKSDKDEQSKSPPPQSQPVPDAKSQPESKEPSIQAAAPATEKEPEDNKDSESSDELDDEDLMKHILSKEEEEKKEKAPEAKSETEETKEPEQKSPKKDSRAAEEEMRARAIEEEQDEVEKKLAHPSLKVFDRYASKSRVNLPFKPTQEFIEDTQLKVERMTYVQYRKMVGAILAGADGEKLTGAPTCITTFGDFVAIGNSQGAIRLFNPDESVQNLIQHKELTGKRVNSIDVNKAQTHLIAGFDNGALMLWDLGKHSVAKIATEIHKSTPVLCVRFLKGQKLTAVSTDAAGRIKITEFTKAMFGMNANSKPLFKDKCVFTACPLFHNSLHPSNAEAYSPIALGGSNGVRIAVTEPNFSVVWSYKCPIAIEKALPYLDWGHGAVPGNAECESLLLAIAWERFIQLVEIRDVMQPNDDNYVLNGYYESDSEITGICWLSEGVLAVSTVSNKLRLLYSGSFVPKAFKSYQKASARIIPEDLEPAYQFKDQALMPRMKTERPGSEKGGELEERVSCHQTVAWSGSKVLYLCESSAVGGTLYRWNDYIDDLGKANKWEEGLQVCLKIYTGKIKGFADLPEQTDIRMSAVRAALKSFLYNYIKYIFESSDKDNKNAGVAIGFCITISATEELFGYMLNMFKDHQQESVYVEALEPFVLAGKFRTDPQAQVMIQLIFDHYAKRPEMIEKLLLNLFLNQSENNTDVSYPYLCEICVKEKLFFLYIYIKTLTKNSADYAEPLVAMGNELKVRAANPDNVDVEIENIYNQEKLVLGSARFMCYMILWYMDLCFNWVKFPKRYNEDDMCISVDIRPAVVYRTLNWLVTAQSGLSELVRFDFPALIAVLRQLFVKDHLRDMILNPDKYLGKGSSLSRSYVELLKRIETAAAEAEGKKDCKDGNGPPQTLHRFYRFLAEVAALPEVVIPSEMCVEAVKRLSAYNEESKGVPVDRKLYEQLMLTMLKSCKSFTKEQIESLIVVFSSRAYMEVLIFLREANGDYIKCFDTYVGAKDREVRSKIFPWLAAVHSKLSEGSDGFVKLKAAIYDNLEKLLELDLTQTTAIVDTWFKQQHEHVVEKLKTKPDVQLKYVQRILNDKKALIEEVMKEQAVSSTETEEYQKYSRLLEIHIELLCRFHPEDVTLELKKKYYPIANCLTICKRMKHEEAIAYLLKRAGDFAESINIYLMLLKRVGAELIDEQKKDQMHDNIKRFNKYFTMCMKVCRKNSSAAGGEDGGQNMWFMVLDYLYDVMLKLFDMRNGMGEDQIKRNVFKVMFDQISAELNDCIKKLLTEMIVYVPFPIIMTRVSEKHGELEIESFKEMFTNMLSSYYQQLRILETASKIIGNDVANQFRGLSKHRHKGFIVAESVCAKCDQPLSTKGDIPTVIYDCGHIYHGRCVKPRATCYACTYKEIKAFSLDQLVKKNAGKKADDDDKAVEEGKTEDDKKEELDESKDQKVQTKRRKEQYITRMMTFERVKLSMQEMAKIKTAAGERKGSSNNVNK